MQVDKGTTFSSQRYSSQRYVMVFGDGTASLRSDLASARSRVAFLFARWHIRACIPRGSRKIPLLPLK